MPTEKTISYQFLGSKCPLNYWHRIPLEPRLEAVRTGKGGKGHELREKVANTQAEVRKEKVPTEESD